MSIISHPALKVLVPDEHHMLNDLPFYEVARVGRKCTLRLAGPKRQEVSERDTKASSGRKPFGF